MSRPVEMDRLHFALLNAMADGPEPFSITYGDVNLDTDEKTRDGRGQKSTISEEDAIRKHLHDVVLVGSL